MIRRHLIILVSASILSSCATTNPLSFTEVQQSNQHLKTQHERVTGGVEAECSEGLCTIPEQNLVALTGIITTLNDENEARAEAHNKLVDSLNHTEYASAAKDRAIKDLKREQRISKAMQLIERMGWIGACFAFGLCGG